MRHSASFENKFLGYREEALLRYCFHPKPFEHGFLTSRCFLPTRSNAQRCIASTTFILSSVLFDKSIQNLVMISGSSGRLAWRLFWSVSMTLCCGSINMDHPTELLGSTPLLSSSTFSSSSSTMLFKKSLLAVAAVAPLALAQQTIYGECM